MNRKFGATGLMFAVVGGLTASGATSAMAEGLPNAQILWVYLVKILRGHQKIKLLNS